MLKNLILRTRSCCIFLITQPQASWHLHFKPTNMVALKCFVPQRYQAPMGQTWGDQPLNIFVCVIHRVERYASHTARNPTSPYPGTHSTATTPSISSFTQGNGRLPTNDSLADAQKLATLPWQKEPFKIGWEPNDKGHACPSEPRYSITLSCTFHRWKLAHPSPNTSTPPHGRT